MKNFAFKVGTMLASVALLITTVNVNSACIMFVHQPKLPQNTLRLRKF